MDLGREHALVAAQVVTVEEQIPDIVHAAQDQVHPSGRGSGQRKFAGQPPAVIVYPLGGLRLGAKGQLRQSTGAYEIGADVARDGGRQPFRYPVHVIPGGLIRIGASRCLAQLPVAAVKIQDLTGHRPFPSGVVQVALPVGAKLKTTGPSWIRWP